MPRGDLRHSSRLRRAATATGRAALGDQRRIGVWILPLFVATALLGAVLAGALVVLYYSQQVRELETTTAEGRRAVEQASEEVAAAVAEARDVIAAEVAAVQAGLATDPPVSSPTEAGVYAVAADHARGEVRVASAFTFFSDDQASFLVTTARLVTSQTAGTMPSVRLFLPGGVVEATVNGADPSLDLAVLVVDVGGLPVLPWRPADQVLARGDVLYLVGIAGADAPAVVPGTVGALAPGAIVPSMPVNEFLSGGPLVDDRGQVVGVASISYAPFGRVDGDPLYAAPVRGICITLVECTEEDVGEGVFPPAVERVPAPDARPPASPTPAPTPTPTAEASPTPTIATPPPPPSPDEGDTETPAPTGT